MAKAFTLLFEYLAEAEALPLMFEYPAEAKASTLQFEYPARNLMLESIEACSSPFVGQIQMSFSRKSLQSIIVFPFEQFLLGFPSYL